MNDNALAKRLTLAVSFLFLFVSCTLQETVKTSQILYMVSSLEDKATWLLDLDTGDNRKIVNDPHLLARGWSPSGNYILFDGIGEHHAGEIWISNSDGSNIQKIFDAKDYPEISYLFGYNKATGISHYSFWLNDTIILIDTELSAVISFDLKEKTVLSVKKNISILEAPSVNAPYYRSYGLILQEAGKKERIFVFPDGRETNAPLNLGEISYDGTQSAYISDGTNDGILNIMSDDFYILASGINKSLDTTNERILVHQNHFLINLQWSPDGEKLFYQERLPDAKQDKCIVVNATNGSEIYNRECANKGNFLWSPRSDGFLIQPNLQQYVFYRLDGTVQTLLEVPPNTDGTYQVVDWRLIETP